MMNWPSLLTRLVPVIVITLVVLTTLGLGLTTMAIVLAAATGGIVLSEYAQPWLTTLLGRVLAIGRMALTGALGLCHACVFLARRQKPN